MAKDKNPLESIFFPVRKVKASEFLLKNSPLTFTKNMDHLIVVDTPTGPLAVNACSKNYELITNRELVTPIYEKLLANHELKVNASHRQFSKFYIDFIMQDKLVKLERDQLIPKVRLTNSYDGSVKYSFTFGFYRVVCSNGMMIPEKGLASNKIKMMHTPAAGDDRALNKTMESIEQFLTVSKDVSKSYKPLIDSKRTWQEALKRIEEAALETSFPKKQKEAAIQRLEVEKNMGYPLNDFLIYNAINFAIHNADTAQVEHKRDKVDAQVLKFLIEN